jgi:hypothetical protein
VNIRPEPPADQRTRFSAPFAPGHRASGVLLHVTSLPSRFGIGDVGLAALAWFDQLVATGQSWWQVPLGPSVYSHSPCQALSSFGSPQRSTHASRRALTSHPDRVRQPKAQRESCSRRTGNTGRRPLRPANRGAKPVITATQMLESMSTYRLPSEPKHGRLECDSQQHRLCYAFRRIRYPSTRREQC